MHKLLTNINIKSLMNSLKKSKVLVTGATSYLGIRLIEQLENKVGQIIGITQNVQKRVLFSEGFGKKVKLFNLDIKNFYKTKIFIKKIKPDRIIHLAAYSNADRDKQIIKKSMEVNATGLINLLKSIEKTKINSVVNVSTVDVYGNARPPFSETSMASPISPYGIFKLSAENISNLYYHVYNLPIVNLRLSMVYGCLQPPNKIIPFIIESCIKRKKIKMTLGHQTRDFIYVDDAVNAIIRASISKSAFGKTFNIASGQEISIRDLTKKISRLTKRSLRVSFGKLPMKKGDMISMRIKTDHAKKVLKWKAKTSLENGLKKVIKSDKKIRWL